MQTISCKHNIIISDLVLKELEYQQLSSEAAVMIQTLQDKIEIEYANRQDKQRATQINTYYNDALHAAIALRRSVPLLTKNVKDFAHIPNLHVMRIDAF